MKIVGVLLMSAILFAGIAAMGLHRTASPEPPARLSPREPAIATDRLAHCHTVTVPEPGCQAAWEAERRRFFRDDAR